MMTLSVKKYFNIIPFKNILALSTILLPKPIWKEGEKEGWIGRLLDDEEK